METEQVARPLTSTEGTKNDIWARKCKLLKRKCEEYEEVSVQPVFYPEHKILWTRFKSVVQPFHL